MPKLVHHKDHHRLQHITNANIRRAVKYIKCFDGGYRNIHFEHHIHRLVLLPLGFYFNLTLALLPISLFLFIFFVFVDPSENSLSLFVFFFQQKDVLFSIDIHFQFYGHILVFFNLFFLTTTDVFQLIRQLLLIVPWN